MTLLHRAVLNHDIKATEMLLAHKALVDSKDNEEKTALHHAIFWQDIEIAKKLIGCKAQVNAKNKHGQTPLHVAAFTGDRALIELLSQHGADINAKDEQGNTPLHVAVINDQQDIIELLIKLGAQLTSLNKCEETPVYSAARNGFQDIFNILSNHCAVGTAGQTGTYVHRAAFNGHVEAIKMFIAAGVGINKQAINGSTALHKAVRNHKADAVQLLLQLKADPNITDGRGLTPLHCAIEENYIEAAEILVKHGASIFKAFKNVPSALNFAFEKHNREMIKMIAHYHQDLLHYTVVQNDIEAATMLLDLDVPVDCKDGANKTSLYIAAERGYEEMAKFLLRRGANITCQELSISQFLLFLKKQGADINQTNEKGQTLLHLAAIANDIDSVKRLLESGAHIDQQDNHNKSPLHIAVEGQRRSLVDLLLESGANVNLKDDTGSTPLYKASMLRETWIRGKLACFGGNLA